MSARLTDRVLRNYTHHDIPGQGSPIEIMSRIYPGMFGGGLDAAAASVDSAGPSDLVDIGIGTYLQTDPAIAEAVIAGMRAGNLHYLRLPEVNEAVARKYLDEQGVTLDPQTQVFLTAGARTAMTLALLRYLEPGDRVIVPDPDYVGLAHVARGLGANVIRAPMVRDEDGALSVDLPRLIETVRSGCRLVMITNPNNPTGYVWTSASLHALVHAVVEQDALLLSNEVYDKLTFNGVRHHSALACGAAEHTVVVCGPGKAYDMTGIPLGWLAGSRDLLRPLADVAFMFHIPTPSAPALYAGLAALSEPLRSDHPRKSVEILDNNARLTAQVFAEVPGFKFPAVGGGQFGFPWVGVDDAELCAQLKRSVGVTLMPGSAWGRMGRGHVRVALANTPEVHERGLDRLRAGLAQIDLLRQVTIASPPRGVFGAVDSGG
jgi:aspartate/methionine/tyrosine aminotransferase